MLSLINQTVNHKAWGTGTVISQEGDYFVVKFDVGEKKFAYPNSFAQFLTAADPAVHEQIQADMKVYDAAVEQTKQDSLAEREIKRQEILEKSQASVKKRKAEQARANAAFKCGPFPSVTEAAAPEGETGPDLDELIADCLAEAMKLKQVKRNGLCLLTAKAAKGKEKDRFVFAAFLLAENTDYRVKLSEEEAQSLLFWHYHANENNPHKPAWSSGAYRYFEDKTAAQILREIACLKKGTEEETLAAELFQQYCLLNNLEAKDLGEPAGALTQTE